jgi:hypothetical protein
MALRTFVRSAIQCISDSVGNAQALQRRICTTLSLWFGNSHLQQPFFPTNFVVPSPPHSTQPSSLPSLLFEELDGYLTPHASIWRVC